MFSSPLSDNGQVGWLKGVSKKGEAYAVRYPSIRWKQLRDVFGWAALQHHSLIHTVVSFTSSRDNSGLKRNPAARLNVLLSLKQASFVCFVPRNKAPQSFGNMWIEGDIYAQSSYSRVISLPVFDTPNGELEFDLFLSADYEIRLFGDPHFTEAGEIPVSRVSLSIDIYDPPTVRIGDPFISPDIVEGWTLGNWLGVCVQNNEKWNTLSAVTVNSQVCLRSCIISVGKWCS